jgi:hypothetical protein
LAQPIKLPVAGRLCIKKDNLHYRILSNTVSDTLGKTEDQAQYTDPKVDEERQ